MSQLVFPIWVVYDKPRDYPRHFIARLWDGMTNTPTETFIIGPDLMAIRDTLPAGLACMGRLDADDVCIVEVWL